MSDNAMRWLFGVSTGLILGVMLGVTIGREFPRKPSEITLVSPDGTRIVKIFASNKQAGIHVFSPKTGEHVCIGHAPEFSGITIAGKEERKQFGLSR